MTMEYGKAAMEALFDNLEGYRDDLISQSAAVQDAATSIDAAWDTDAKGEFVKIHTEWNDAIEDTQQLLNAIAAAVENALGEALGTDGKVGDGFAEIG